MIEWIEDFMGDINSSALVISLIAWIVTLLWVWKWADPNIMRFHVRIVLSFVSLPLFYLIINKMSDN